MDKEVVISFKTILLTLVMLLGFYVIYRLGPIIAIILIACLITIAMENAVNKLKKLTVFNRQIHRSLAVLIAYALLILAVIVVATLIVPPVIAQTQKLLLSLNNIINDIKLTTNVEFSLTQLLPQASSLSGNVFNLTVSIFANVATFFTMLVISIYLSLDWPNLKRRFISLMPLKIQDEIKDTLRDIEESVGHWLKGESFLMTVVGSMCFVGLVTLNVDYPLAIALLSGVLEAVPMIGPLISLIIASIIGFSISPAKGFAVIGLYVLIQQIENNIIVPKVMGRVSGFSPLVILIALLVGTNFFGIVGAIMAVPTTIIAVVIIKHVLRYSAAQQ